MILTDYLNPTEALPYPFGLPKSASVYGKLSRLGIEKNIVVDSNSLVIIGIGESRNSNNPAAANAPDTIRPFLYSLSGANIKNQLIDLGNLKITGNTADTYMATRDLLAFILDKGATCLVLGGTQELTWPIYLAASEKTKPLNVSLIDYTIDLGSNDGDFSSTCYAQKFLSEPNENLFTLNFIGYQGYLTDSKHISLVSDKNFELARLGFVRGAMAEVEPTLRDSHIVSLDMGSIKQSDSPGSLFPSPNGLFSEEICQLARYAGTSSKNKVFGIFELNSSADPVGQSSHLAAQIVWHFIDGFNARSNYIEPSKSSGTFKKYYVKSPIPKVELLFIQNTTTDCWWMVIPPTPKTQNEPKTIACSYNDYLSASKGDVPERWLRAWKRVS